MYSVTDKMPESGKRVIFGWVNSLGKRRTSIGFYAAPKSIDADDYDEPTLYEYDEEKDGYWLHEGWYEETLFDHYTGKSFLCKPDDSF